VSVSGAEEPQSGSETARTATSGMQGAELTDVPLMWAAKAANRVEAPVSAVARGATDRHRTPAERLRARSGTPNHRRSAPTAAAAAPRRASPPRPETFSSTT
jgi:hypothetical protein